jgi:hypothetical protein
METRKATDDQVVTKCNVCGQGEYQEINRTEFEDIIEPVYQALEADLDALPVE